MLFCLVGSGDAACLGVVVVGGFVVRKGLDLFGHRGILRAVLLGEMRSLD